MSYSTKIIPPSRIATIDLGRVSKSRHNIISLLEVDITEARKNIVKARKTARMSLNAWLIKQISDLLAEYKSIAAYSRNKRTLYLFDQVNASIVIEKIVKGEKVPVPYLITDANNKTAEELTQEIEDAKRENAELKTNSNQLRLYNNLPSYLRRIFWRKFLNKPRIAFRKMGNVVITSLGMMGKVNGWFIQTTLHPIAFGMGSVTPKPWVSEGEIKIREILHMTVLFDHDVIDGAEMARFVNALVKKLEKGLFNSIKTEEHTI